LKRVIAQCLWNYYPWVADHICRLKKYDSVVWTLRSQSLRGSVDQYPLPVYASHTADKPRLKRFANRVTNKVLGVPLLFEWAARGHGVVLMHAHLAPQGMAFLPISRRLGLPMVVSLHGHHVYTYLNESPSLASATRRLFREAALFTTVSEKMRQDVVSKGCPHEKVVVHHVGVDVDQFAWHDRPPHDGKTILLTVANFAKRKGLPYLLQALALIRDGFPGLELRIVGGNPFHSEVEAEVHRLITDLGVRDNVILIGSKTRASLTAEYHQADIFVLPSVTTPDGEKEGIPVVLMEAMATGLPVISTIHAGIPELVVDGRSGYLVPEGDTRALAASIALLLGNRSMWRPMGQAGRNRIEEHFNLARQIDKLESIYDEVLCRHQRDQRYSHPGSASSA
jgi:colanic acid/amylovoran biosynthesis glycosyltransferase